MTLYIEITIDADFGDVWLHTQSPDLHERWDLRFTRIEYLPPTSDDDPQRFLYSTRLGFGLAINGRGESVAEKESRDGATSSLKFWSDDPKSLIREGAGYWQYAQAAAGIQFITGYDYDVRFGWPGRVFDRIVFRPLIGWATAWSFDRLRLWLEQGVEPGVAFERSLVHAVARLNCAFVIPTGRRLGLSHQRIWSQREIRFPFRKSLNREADKRNTQSTSRCFSKQMSA